MRAVEKNSSEVESTEIPTKYCTQCTKEYPRTTDFFYTKPMKSGNRYFDSWCKKCRIEWNKAYQRRKRNDPEWCARRRETLRRSSKKKYERMMANPVLHAKHCEEKRLTYAMALQREGREPNRHWTLFPIEEHNRLVPLTPLRPYLDELLHANDYRHVARELGVHEDIIRKYQNGNKSKVFEVTADQICTRLNLPFAALYPDSP